MTRELETLKAICGQWTYADMAQVALAALESAGITGQRALGIAASATADFIEGHQRRLSEQESFLPYPPTREDFRRRSERLKMIRQLRAIAEQRIAA